MIITQPEALCQERPEPVASDEVTPEQFQTLSGVHGVMDALSRVDCAFQKELLQDYDALLLYQASVHVWAGCKSNTGYRLAPFVGQNGLNHLCPFKPRGIWFSRKAASPTEEAEYQQGFVRGIDALVDAFSSENIRFIGHTVQNIHSEVHDLYFRLRCQYRTGGVLFFGGILPDDTDLPEPLTPEEISLELDEIVLHVEDYGSYWTSPEFATDSRDEDNETDNEVEMKTKPFFNSDSCALEIPPGWDGDRSNLGDIAMVLIEHESSPSGLGVGDKLLADAQSRSFGSESVNSVSFVPVALADLKRPIQGGKDELLLNRFLCRKGGALLVGPSGIGKSSFVTQLALCWSIAKPALGIIPARPLKILIIQAENDDGDIAEQRDGVIEGMHKAGMFTTGDCEKAVKSVMSLHVCTVTGDTVGDMLREVAPGYDLVIIDPLFAFIGGDVMAAKDASHFLREVINPVISELNIGVILVHHTNKPPKGREKDGWQAGDFAYLGAGSAELTNWPRAVLAIRSIGHDSIFELRAAKRGKRLHWEDASGNHTTAKLISHSEHGICWREVTNEDVAEIRRNSDGKPKVAVLDLIEKAKEITHHKKVWTKSELLSHLGLSLERSPDYLRKNVLPALRECGEFYEEKTNRGKSPVYLIGERMAVEDEINKIRIEG